MKNKKEPQLFGYARVSSLTQNEERQIVALMKAGVCRENIYMDKMSGKNFARKNYQKLLKKLRKGDILFVLSINRLGRNYFEIIEQWEYLVKKKGVDIVVLDMPLLDTRYAKDLLGTFISDIVLQILSFVAENDRNNIRISQAQGIAVAKERGVVFGRPRNMDIEDFVELYRLFKRAALSNTEIRKRMNLSTSTFYRYLREMNCLNEIKAL